MKKFLRDLIIIGLLFGGFYLLVMTADLLSNEPPPSRSDFSDARVRADDAMGRRDYRDAIPYLQELIEKDPYNSYAIAKLAECAHVARQDYRARGGEANAEQIARYTELAIEAYTAALDFPRYANGARFQLAVIRAQDGDGDEALALLRDAFEDGYYSRGGIDRYQAFEELRGLEEFRSLVALELKNQRSGRRGGMRVR